MRVFLALLTAMNWDLTEKEIHFELFEIADTTGADCRRAVPSPISDFEDAVMSETAIRINADCIVTKNKKDYLKSPVPVFLSDDFIKKVEQENGI